MNYYETRTAEEQAAALAAYELKRAQEVEQANRATEKFNAKLTAIAEALTALGEPCARVRDSNVPGALWFHLALTNYPGEQIDISRENSKGRINISGEWPSAQLGTRFERFLPEPGDRPYITVDAEKDAPTIARDILRRFLPFYREQYRAQKLRRDNAQTYHNAQSNLVDRLSKVLGVPARKDSPNNLTIYKPVYASFRIDSATSVSLERFSMTGEQALELIALIQTWKKDEAE